MGALEICLVGLAVVIVSILLLRLHAFLGLLLGAFVVSVLTPGVGTEAMGQVAAGFGEGCRKIGILIALAIGCGSKPLPWMNDSGFWIVSKMSGMNETETLKTFSVMLSLMGVVGFAVVWLASALIPLS